MRFYAFWLGALLMFQSSLSPALDSEGWPSFAKVRAAYPSSDFYLLDRDRRPLQQVRIDPAIRRLAWTPLSEISVALRAAAVASEDRRFYQHSGVDWLAFCSAALHDLFAAGERSPRGASTISMQLAGLLDPLRVGQGGKRSLSQKWAQARGALELEQLWTKDEILEAYLNLSTFRGELVGVRAASEALFHRSPDALEQIDANLLAVLLRSPNAAPGLVASRACALARSLGSIQPCADTQNVAELVLGRGIALPLRFNAAPHLAQKLLPQSMSSVPAAQSTLRGDLQRAAVESLDRQLQELDGREVEDGAIVVLDNKSGDVLAYVGSSGAHSRSRLVDGVGALRQAGSTLKPFLYELAFERGWLTPASLLNDSPINLSTPEGVYLPQNYDRDFKGWISARTALASSLNVPAVRTLLLVGPETFYERLRALGFESLKDGAEHYGYSLALGGADLSLLELTNAYRTLANGGLASDVRFLLQDAPKRKRRVLSEESAFLVTDILSDKTARALTFGLDNPLETAVWSAVKTGTSKDMRDNWCIGFTSRYTVGVWVGNFSGKPMRDVSGVTGAAPIWRDLVDNLHQREQSIAPSPPAGLVRTAVSFGENAEAPREEWFLPGTVLKSSSRPAETSLAPRIAYPENGTIIALDPDIPSARQRVEFLSQPARKDVSWTLDGVAVGAGSRMDWRPTAGKHRLVLSGQDREFNQVSFEVRGSQPAIPKAGRRVN